MSVPRHTRRRPGHLWNFLCILRNRRDSSHEAQTQLTVQQSQIDAGLEPGEIHWQLQSGRSSTRPHVRTQSCLRSHWVEQADYWKHFDESCQGFIRGMKQTSAEGSVSPYQNVLFSEHCWLQLQFFLLAKTRFLKLCSIFQNSQMHNWTLIFTNFHVQTSHKTNQLHIHYRIASKHWWDQFKTLPQNPVTAMSNGAHGFPSNNPVTRWSQYKDTTCIYFHFFLFLNVLQ